MEDLWEDFSQNYYILSEKYKTKFIITLKICFEVKIYYINCFKG